MNGFRFGMPRSFFSFLRSAGFALAARFALTACAFALAWIVARRFSGTRFELIFTFAIAALRHNTRGLLHQDRKGDRNSCVRD